MTRTKAIPFCIWKKSWRVISLSISAAPAISDKTIQRQPSTLYATAIRPGARCRELLRPSPLLKRQKKCTEANDDGPPEVAWPPAMRPEGHEKNKLIFR